MNKLKSKHTGRANTGGASKKYLIGGVIICAGLLISFLLSWLVHNLEMDELKSEIERLGHDRSELFQKEIQNNIDIIRFVEGFFNASESVKRLEFYEFTKDIFTRQADIFSIYWTPRILHSSRQIFRDSMRGEGFEGFYIKEVLVGPGGGLVIAGEREEYFPIQYVEPFEKDRIVLGFNVISDYVRKEALEKARDKGTPGASGRIRLIGDESGDFGCQIFLPVYKKGVPHNNIQERRQNLVGFVSVIFKVGETFWISSEELTPIPFDVYVYDMSAPEDRSFLYFSPSPFRTTADEKKANNKYEALKYSRIFDVADRKWQIMFVPTEEFIATHKMRQSKFVFFSCVFLAILIAFYITDILGRTAQIEKLVDERTVELNEANKTLANEISVRKHMEVGLKNAYEVTRNILRMAPFGIFIVDQKGDVEYVNPSMISIAGTSFAQFSSINAFKIPTYVEIGLDKKIKAVLGGETFTMGPVKYTSYYSHKITVRNITGIPLEEEGERKALIFVQDITELKNKEEELRKAMNIKSAFTSMVSHELRTPLTAIKEGISIVLDGITGEVSAEQRRFLDISKRNVDRLARLINDVLDYQKMESGKQKFKLAECDMNDIAMEVYNTLVRSAEEQGLKLGISLDREMPKLSCNRDKIIQVLMNITHNAIKFTEKGSVSISTTKEKDNIHVAVSDTGPGIKEEDLPKVFQPFEQLEMGKDRKTGGSGLGLTISKGIIERHDGKIWVESVYGQGTTFHFILPIKK